MAHTSDGNGGARWRRRLAAGAATLALGAATACGGGPAGEPDALRLWIMAGTNPDSEPYLDALKAEFEDRTGVGLDVQLIQWADAHDRITTAMAGGELPDVAEIGTTWAAEFGAAGALTDLAPRITEDGLDADLLPALHEAGTLDGATYGMPWYAGVRALIYRADILAEHQLAPPTTWDELRDVGLALRELEPELIPFPVPGGAEHGLAPFIWGAGGEIAEPTGDGGWRATVAAPAAVEGIAFYTSLATEHGLSVAAAETWRETDQLTSFQNGESVMVINGNWTVSTLLAADPSWADRIGVVPIPGQHGGLAPSFVGGSLLGDFNSPHPDLVWTLITLMTSGDFASRWAEQTGYFPAQRSLVAELRARDEPLVAPFAEQLLSAGASLPVTDRYGVIQGEQILPRMLQSILSGERSVQEAAETAAAEMDETFAD
ncbi:extracellular solute-binding protein [Streptomyces sp. DSM 44915]|uniref:Extracellular solute-binding protein n=1 Tax=Streptomyces chisholmiae TaxID=3075540 RepID=A0ABU2JJ81_9ACTN|nr:extracellular solute-binding protein [Streptomyces sp. DSM 44915]MDT0265050.1 extracellular solute-binding protein [Streptomyces sp. DSM 44915]